MPNTYYNIVARKGQTAFEIALQEYGSLDGLIYLLEDNVFLHNYVGQSLEGKTIRIRDNSVVNKQVVSDYAKNGHIPSNVFGYFWIPSSGNHELEDNEYGIPLNHYIL